VELGAMVRRERSETALKARESLFEIMRARVLDVNAFTRSKVLQVGPARPFRPLQRAGAGAGWPPAREGRGVST